MVHLFPQTAFLVVTSYIIHYLSGLVIGIYHFFYRSIEEVFRQEPENALNQLFVIESDIFFTMTSMILSVIIPVTHEMDSLQEMYRHGIATREISDLIEKMYAGLEPVTYRLKPVTLPIELMKYKNRSSRKR